MDSQEGMKATPGIAETGFATRWEALTSGLDTMVEKLGLRRNGEGLRPFMPPDVMPHL